MGGDVFRDEYSLTFDGSDDYISIADPGDFTLSTSGQMTIVAWFKADSSGSGGRRIFSGDKYDIVLLIRSDHTICGQLFNSPNNPSIISSSTYNDDQWHQVAFMRDSSNLRLAIDGVFESDVTDSTSGTGITISEVRIGKRNNTEADETSGVSFWIGKISEIAVYNTALSTGQVKTIYNGREPYNHKEGVGASNLTHWWRMGDGTERGSGTTIYDMTANDNDGTMANFAATAFTGDTP